jgi:hypothetical protein
MPRDKELMSVLRQSVSFVETDLSSNLRKSLEKVGLKTYKTKTEATRGMPDIYATGGNWIESKIERRIPSPRFTPLKLFTGLQRRELDQLAAAGDGAWACVMWAYDRLDQRIGVLPWYYFRRIRLWPLKTVHHFTIPYHDKKTMDLYVQRHLVTSAGRMSMVPFQERFDAWQDRDDVSYYKELITPTYNDAEFTDDNLTAHKRNLI